MECIVTQRKLTRSVKGYVLRKADVILRMAETMQGDDLVEEIRRLGEQAKALQDVASTFISRIKLDEESLRQRALALDSDIKRLRKSLAAAVHQHTIDANDVEKVMLSFLKEFEEKVETKIACSQETEPMGTAGPLALGCWY